MVDGMDMEHLANMYCSDRFSISTAGLKAGTPAGIMIMLVNDDHKPTAGVAPASITVNVK